MLLRLFFTARSRSSNQQLLLNFPAAYKTYSHHTANGFKPVGALNLSKRYKTHTIE
jgi:hypothetical protein